MNLNLVVVFSALVGIAFTAAPSPSFAQLSERIEQMRKQAEQKRQAEQKPAPQPAPQAAPKAQSPVSVQDVPPRGKKGKGKGKAYAKGQNK